MKLATGMFAAALALAPVAGLAQVLPPNKPNSTTFTFPLTVSPGAATCLPHAKGVVIDHTFGNVENLEVIITGLPPKTDFVLFVIQVPNAPSGSPGITATSSPMKPAPASLTLSGGSILGPSSFPLALCPRLMFSQHRPRYSPNQRRAR